MPKVFSDVDRERVLDLHADGLSYPKIAKEMGWTYASADRSVGKIVNEGRKSNRASITLDEMTRKDRYRLIKERLETTPRARLTFETFNSDEKALFVDEFLSIVKSTDTLTEVEEQTLFTAMVEFVFAHREIKRDTQEWEWYQDSLNDKISNSSLTFRAVYNNAHKLAQEKHFKTYTDLLHALKMSRTQRLDKVKSDKRTLVDLTTELSSKSSQTKASEDIFRYSQMRDKELEAMLKNGYLHGVFGVRRSK